MCMCVYVLLVHDYINMRRREPRKKIIRAHLYIRCLCIKVKFNLKDIKSLHYMSSSAAGSWERVRRSMWDMFSFQYLDGNIKANHYRVIYYLLLGMKEVPYRGISKMRVRVRNPTGEGFLFLVVVDVLCFLLFCFWLSPPGSPGPRPAVGSGSLALFHSGSHVSLSGCLCQNPKAPFPAALKDKHILFKSFGCFIATDCC